MRDERGKWLAGVSPNPSGKPKQKFMTEALQLYLLRPADMPESKPRNAAEAIARQMVKQAVDGCTTSQSMIYDRMEGKAIQTIKDETERAPMDIMEAARRLAFVLNTAAMNGEQLTGPIAALAKQQPMIDVTPAPEPVASAIDEGKA